MTTTKQPKAPTTDIQIYTSDRKKLENLKVTKGEYMRDVVSRVLKQLEERQTIVFDGIKTPKKRKIKDNFDETKVKSPLVKRYVKYPEVVEHLRKHGERVTHTSLRMSEAQYSFGTTNKIKNEISMEEFSLQSIRKELIGH